MAEKPEEFMAYVPASDKDINSHRDSSEHDIFLKNLIQNKNNAFRSVKSGLFFPTAVIVSLILLSLILIFIFRKIIYSDLTAFKSENRNSFALESTLMNKFKIDTYKKIETKNNEINLIKNKLNIYNKKLKELEEIVFAKQKGAEIREKDRTDEYSAMSISELENTIKKIEAEKIEAENNLDSQLKEKKLLEKEAEDKKNSIFKETDSNLLNISEIQSSLEKQKSVNTQLYLMQKNIFYNIQRQDYLEAGKNIDNYRAIINLEANNNIPGIYEKRESSNELMKIIEDYISFKDSLDKKDRSKISDSRFLTELHFLYENILTSIEYQDFENAEKALAELNEYLNMKSVSANPDINTRTAKHLRIASIIKKYLEFYKEKQYFTASSPGIKNNSDGLYNYSDKKVTAEKRDKSLIDNPEEYRESLYSDYTGNIVFFGKIASINNKTVTIEPFFDSEVNPGESFIIKQEGSETARGVFLSSTADSARGEITQIKNSEKKPGIESLIFLVRE